MAGGVCASARSSHNSISACRYCDARCANADMIEEGSVGRFWGYRGLHRELAVRQVTPDVGVAAGRNRATLVSGEGADKDGHGPSASTRRLGA